MALVCLVAAALIFTNLGRDHLWSDEGDTAVLARNILAHGVPTAWDGVSFMDAADYGKRVTDDFVMVSHPWLQYYVAAGSMAIFGETPLAVRLPFALCGLATIVLVYVLVFRATGHRWTALTAAVLLTLSVQFLLYARQGRNYSLNAFLTCLLVLQFAQLRSWTHSLLFALTAILLFHTHPIAVAPIAALGLMTLVYRPARPLAPWFWRAMPVVALFTVPWFFVARQGLSETTSVVDGAGRFLQRLAQFGVEAASVTSIAGAIVLYLWARRRMTAAGKKLSPVTASAPPGSRQLALALVSITAMYAVMMALTQSRDALWAFGIRYTSAVLPFSAMLLAMAIATVSRGQRRVWIALVLVFGFTKVGRLTPWTFWQEPTAVRDAAAAVTFHAPRELVDRVLRRGLLKFVESLVDHDPGTTARVSEFLARHAAPHDVVITNYAWEPLYFHTRLPLGMTILRSYPIYETAREKNLPPYVFGAERARWIVWRRAWGPYRGHDLAGLLDALDQARVPVTRVATIPETMWENRENIHFRRFAGGEYLFAWYGDVPDTMIFRVDWPKTSSSAD